MTKKNQSAPEAAWFRWVPSSATDVSAVWRRHGYVPPSEDPIYAEKWRAWKANLADLAPPFERPPEPVFFSSVTALPMRSRRVAR